MDYELNLLDYLLIRYRSKYLDMTIDQRINLKGKLK